LYIHQLPSSIDGSYIFEGLVEASDDGIAGVYGVFNMFNNFGIVVIIIAQ
jgi:hypothetical protein